MESGPWADAIENEDGLRQFTRRWCSGRVSHRYLKGLIRPSVMTDHLLKAPGLGDLRLREQRPGANPVNGAFEVINEQERKEVLLKTVALQNAIFNRANFSSIATDERGIIQVYSVGAERKLGYQAAEVVNKNTPVDISDSGSGVPHGAGRCPECHHRPFSDRHR